MADYTDASRLNQIYDAKEEIKNYRVRLRALKKQFPVTEELAEKIRRLEFEIDGNKRYIIRIKAELWKTVDPLPNSNVPYSTFFNRRGRVMPRGKRYR